jgi:hypothetical protein
LSDAGGDRQIRVNGRTRKLVCPQAVVARAQASNAERS